MDTSPSRPEVRKLFQSIRAQLTYLTTSTRPDLSFCSAQLSHISPENITTDDCKFLNASVRKAKIHRHIVFLKLEVELIYIAGYADAGFANNGDLTFQLGFIVLLKGKHDNAATINYGSWKFHRVTRSVLGAEVYAFSHCLGYTLALSKDLSTIFGRKVKTIMFTDSKSLSDTITELGTVSEKHLLIDNAAIRETYTANDLSNVAHVSSSYNIANTFTKAKTDETMLLSLMKTGKLSHPISRWILPQEGSWHTKFLFKKNKCFVVIKKFSYACD